MIIPETYVSCKQIRIKVRMGFKEETLILQACTIEECFGNYLDNHFIIHTR